MANRKSTSKKPEVTHTKDEVPPIKDGTSLIKISDAKNTRKNSFINLPPSLQRRPSLKSIHTGKKPDDKDKGVLNIKFDLPASEDDSTGIDPVGPARNFMFPSQVPAASNNNDEFPMPPLSNRRSVFKRPQSAQIPAQKDDKEVKTNSQHQIQTVHKEQSGQGASQSQTTSQKPTVKNIEKKRMYKKIPHVNLDVAKDKAHTIKLLNLKKTRLDYFAENPKLMTPHTIKCVANNVNRTQTEFKLTRRNSILLPDGKIGISTDLYSDIKKKQGGPKTTDMKLLSILESNGIYIAENEITSRIDLHKSLKRKVSRVGPRPSMIRTHRDSFFKTQVSFSLANDKFYNDGWVTKKKGEFLDESKNPENKINQGRWLQGAADQAHQSITHSHSSWSNDNEIGLEELTIIKWAANRILDTLKSYEGEKEKSIFSYLFLPLKVVFWTERADLQSSASNFSTKSIPNMPLTPAIPSPVPKKSPNSKNFSLTDVLGEILYIQHPDKTLTVFYPSGKLALLQSVTKNGSCQTLLYDENTNNLIGCFGKSYDYFDLDSYYGDVRNSLTNLGDYHFGFIEKNSYWASDRKILLTYDSTGGKIWDADTLNANRQFKWPSHPALNLKVKINFKINEHVTLIGGNLENLTLVFSINEKTIKIKVSTAGDLIRSHIKKSPEKLAKVVEDSNQKPTLLTNTEFTSGTANFLKTISSEEGLHGGAGGNRRRNTDRMKKRDNKYHRRKSMIKHLQKKTGDRLNLLPNQSDSSQNQHDGLDLSQEVLENLNSGYTNALNGKPERKIAKIAGDSKLNKYKIELAQIQQHVGSTIDHVQSLCRQFRGLTKAPTSGTNSILVKLDDIKYLTKPVNFIKINKHKAFKCRPPPESLLRRQKSVIDDRVESSKAQNSEADREPDPMTPDHSAISVKPTPPLPTTTLSEDYLKEQQDKKMAKQKREEADILSEFISTTEKKLAVQFEEINSKCRRDAAKSFNNIFVGKSIALNKKDNETSTTGRQLMTSGASHQQAPCVVATLEEAGPNVVTSQTFRHPSAKPKISKYYNSDPRPRTADLSKKVGKQIKLPLRASSAIGGKSKEHFLGLDFYSDQAFGDYKKVKPTNGNAAGSLFWTSSMNNLTTCRASSAKFHKNINSMNDTLLSSFKLHQCPAFTRASLLGKNFNFNSNNGRVILDITDVEFDVFIGRVLPPDQYVIIFAYDGSDSNKLQLRNSGKLKFLENYHRDKNKLRARPCRQSKSDKFRVFKYDVSKNKLLEKRHHLPEGTFLIYRHGKLIWLGKNFNGYGQTIHDLTSQLNYLDESLDSKILPPDFKFSSRLSKSLEV